MDKSKIRSMVLDKRLNMNSEEVKSKSISIANNFFDSSLYKSAKVIMVYIDFRNEVETKNIIVKAIKDDKRIIIPISIKETRELILSEIKDYDSELGSGAYGILEPKEEFIRRVDPALIDLVIIPGVAFDNAGHRVGYGAGYYDRFLKKLKPYVPKIALAFDLQIVDSIDGDEHDIPVDYIINENSIINCKNNGQD